MIKFILGFLFFDFLAGQTCRKFSCESFNNDTNTDREKDDQILHCLQESTQLKRAGIVDVYQDYCSVKYPDAASTFCKYKEEYYEKQRKNLIKGECDVLQKSERVQNLEERYPGEVCDNLEEEFFCYFGYRQCFKGRCMGYARNEKCVKSIDCELGFYCQQETQTCQLYHQLNETCSGETSCGRAMRCVPQNKTGISYCTPYFFFNDGDKLYHQLTMFDQFLCKSGRAMIEVNKVHLHYGTCGLSFKSKNFDSTCDSSTNCQVDLVYNGIKCDDIEQKCPVEYKPRDFVASVKANCDCSTDGTGLKKCGLKYGDTQWDEVITNVKYPFSLQKSNPPQKSSEITLTRLQIAMLHEISLTTAMKENYLRNCKILYIVVV